MMAERSVTVDDLFRLKVVDEPVVSPSGDRIAFTVTSLDREDNTYRSRIWILDLDDGGLLPFTSGEFRDSRPAWSPDGAQIAFLSDRSSDDDEIGDAQIFVVQASGGEPRRLTSQKQSIGSFEWSPDGRRMLFISAVPEPDTGRDKRDSDVKVIRSARFRADGIGYLDEKYRQVFVLDIESGESRQLTSGPFDHVHATWSPTGYEIACVSNRREGWEFSSVRDIYLIKVESGKIRQLTDGEGRWSLPSWSPDGRRIAALGTRELRSGSSRNEVFLISSTADTRSITAELDVDFRDASLSDWNGYSLDPPRWIGPDRLLVVASVRGTVRAVELDVESCDTEFRTPDTGRIGHPQLVDDGSLVAVRTDFTDPGELVRFTNDGQVEPLTGFNADWVENSELAIPEAIEVSSADGELVHGWLLRPPGLAEGDRAPLLLEIHGGPFGMYADTFMHEFHLLAAQGYGVLFVNPRGSAGYGDRFAGLLLPEMGERDLPDLMAAIDRAVEEPWIDSDRLGVLGGSYGGFMTNWVLAHTDRFRVGVTQRTVTDWYAAWGTDDIFYADERVTFGATPWEDPDIYFRLSPISYVKQIDAPLLIIHSEEDYRCPMPQAEELFVALMRLGKTTELVRFPDESHGLSRTGKPKNRAERLQYILRWFERHL